MRLIVLAAAAALLGGCATINPEPVPGATYAINCVSGQLEHCFTKAKELCPKGYEIVRLRRNNDPIMMIASPDRLDIKCQGQ